MSRRSHPAEDSRHTRRPHGPRSASWLVGALLLALVPLGCSDAASDRTVDSGAGRPRDATQLANPSPEASGAPAETATAAGSPAPAPAGLGSTRDRCTVQTVSDGDSFRCTDGRRVRLLLLDAPEMSQTPFGARSRDALRQRMPRGGTVWLEYDVQRLDRYDRTLAYVWTQPDGGELINVMQARGGWAVAVVFPPNVRHIDEVRRAVADARRANRGLWAEGGFTCEPIERKRGRC